MSKKEDFKSKANQLSEAIKENQRRKDLKTFQEELARRISIAKNGRIAYEKKDTVEAISNYERFLQITAKSLNVEVKDLHPSLFDEKIRISESLLISAICFDLAKMYDHVTNADARRSQYLRLTVLFTNKMPFQNFVAENLYKYLNYTKNIQHKNEFAAVYKSIKAGQKCFIATAVFEDADAAELRKLRKFRDEVLHTHLTGRLFVDTYYRLSPALAEYLSHTIVGKRFTKVLLRIFCSFLPNDRSKTR
jgi:hypothetical protein